MPGVTSEYQAVAVSQTGLVLGATGARGDLIETLICSVATAATGTVSLTDGNGSAIPILAANTPIGVYVVPIGLRARVTTTPGWRITTGAGVTVLAIGRFT